MSVYVCVCVCVWERERERERRERGERERERETKIDAEGRESKYTDRHTLKAMMVRLINQT